jgi:uncharacterized protein YidB (DUF937 family)
MQFILNQQISQPISDEQLEEIMMTHKMQEVADNWQVHKSYDELFSMMPNNIPRD